MSNFLKRTLSLSLALIMLVSLMPVISTATDDEMIIQSDPLGKCLQAAFTDD